MELNYLEYTTSAYMTTNPPTASYSRVALSREGGDGAFLTVESCFNKCRSFSRYRVSEAQYREVVSLFETEKLMEKLMKAAQDTAASDEPVLTGGLTGAAITFDANNIRVTVRNPKEEILPLTEQLNRLAKECGDPIECQKSDVPPEVIPMAPGPPMPNGFIGMGEWAPQPSIHPMMPTEQPGEGEWACTACGYAHNQGKFCAECGMPRTEKTDK